MASLNAVSTYKTAPKFSFPHSGIGAEAPKRGPEPGTYNIVGVDKDKFSRSASYSILGASKVGGAASVGMMSKNPGPGAYAPKDHKSMNPPKWAFGSETRMAEKKTMKAPGPGQYNTITKNDAVQISMSSRFDYTTKEQAPAPGAYTPKFDSVSTIKAAERIHFGSSSRTGFKDNSVPGPGQYNASGKALDAGYKTAPAFSLRPKWKDPPQKHPGPDFMASTTFFK
ncbi:unnamed protein product [Prorocentrum cordatum]|uniref:Outer dense fiber protein 3 n=1 Tax=Prorocentrum cordatum TaxID=2364126 RepID=A0ABN9UDV6_9DINO|nr:unnamed protein product [Polarella glacialis]